MTVLVSLTDEHLEAVRDAIDKLVCLADLGLQVEPLVDQLGDILDLARAEGLHSVDYRRIAEDGARLMAGPPAYPENERFQGLVADVFHLRRQIGER